MTKICTNCTYALLRDYGYSNWTVEGTSFECLKDNHPDDSDIDVFYDKNPKLEFAEKCESFIEGDAVYVDCDQEDGDLSNYSQSEEIKILLKQHTHQP